MLEGSPLQTNFYFDFFILNFTSSYYSYKQTGSFNTWVEDYLNDNPALRPFYKYQPDLEGIGNAIKSRSSFNTDRNLLVQKFRTQYQHISNKEKVEVNISKLQNENCFTVCTAHQPHLFLGPLYVVYKILHAIRLATELNQKIPDCQFVPVYFMGSEDADLQELGNVVVGGKKYTWDTLQTGAVGRMKVDEALLQLLNTLKEDLGGLHHVTSLLQALKQSFTPEKSIEQATLELVHSFFGKYGLLVFLPDDPVSKRNFIPVMKKELQTHFSFACVSKTQALIPSKYHTQLKGREINLFYLQDSIRERIVKTENGFELYSTKRSFSYDEMMDELEKFPERFSPNVILRPLYQEMMLPNVAFIGGGSEMAYWMQLKVVFEEVGIPYPVLVLRNSFLLIEQKIDRLFAKLELTHQACFSSLESLTYEWVMNNATAQLTLDAEIESLKKWFEGIKEKARQTDVTLVSSASSIETKFIADLKHLEQKIFRAEKKKQDLALQQLTKIKQSTHPNGVLQERSESCLYFFAKLGPDLFESVLQNSLALDMQFCILNEQGN